LADAMKSLLPCQLLPLLAKDGRTRWTSRMLVLTALLMAWSSGTTLLDRFEAARGCLLRWYPGRRRPGGTYQGFIAKLRQKGRPLARLVAETFRRHVRDLAVERGCWEIGGWVPFRVDSSKVDATMTVRNERALGSCSRDKSWPQMILTVVEHMGIGLPWSFMRGHARSSERRHLLGLLCTLPKNALLVADAGFVGYAFWKRVSAGGHAFLVRVGSNVKLIRKLGLAAEEKEDGIVWVWPLDQQKRRQPPVALRWIRVIDERGRTMHLLTNILDPVQLSDATAAMLYKMRWGIEVLYRSLKQTLARRKMLSDSPRNARMELTWSVLGLWALLLIKARRCKHAAMEGVAHALRVVRRAMAQPSMSIDRVLSGLKPDRYTRRNPKKARHWPHKKKESPPGEPEARNATEAERLLAEELRTRSTAA
jgi:hypothetical protein